MLLARPASAPSSLIFRAAAAVARVGENARVPAYALNENAVRHAKRLIDARQYVLRSRWQDVQPRAREQNAFLKTHSWSSPRTSSCSTSTKRAPPDATAPTRPGLIGQGDPF
jgi:hypothetical protein